MPLIDLSLLSDYAFARGLAAVFFAIEAERFDTCGVDHCACAVRIADQGVCCIADIDAAGDRPMTN